MTENAEVNDADKTERRFTRRRFVSSLSLGGAGLALPFQTQLAAKVAPRSTSSEVWVAFSAGRNATPAGQLDRFVLDTAPLHSPPLVVAISHGGGPGFERLIALRSRASEGRGKSLLVHRFLDLGRVASIKTAMGSGAAIEEHDGWHLRMEADVTSDSLRRLDAALEVASRMARHVIWVEAGAWATWLPTLERIATANPWLNFVVIGAVEALGESSSVLGHSALELLRKPNVLVHLETWRMFGGLGRAILGSVGYGGVVWGLQNLTSAAVTLDQVRLSVGLGRDACKAVLASRAASAYGLQAHHYA